MAFDRQELHTSPDRQMELTGARTAFVVVFALCQSPVRSLGRDQAPGPSFPTGPPTTPPSLPSCGWLRPTPSSSCATTRLAAATTASPAVECRPTRPVRADPPRKTIRTTTTTGTTTINPAEGLATERSLSPSDEERRPCTGSSGPDIAKPAVSPDPIADVFGTTGPRSEHRRRGRAQRIVGTTLRSPRSGRTEHPFMRTDSNAESS